MARALSFSATRFAAFATAISTSRVTSLVTSLVASLVTWLAASRASARFAVLAGALVAMPHLVLAQEQPRQPSSAERKITTDSGKLVRIGVYVNLKPDCTSGPLPQVRVSTPPANGAVIVRRAKLQARNHAKCPTLEIPGYVAFYKSRQNFTGDDLVRLEIRDAFGNLVRNVEIIVTVRPATMQL